jgi:hypothetical protein
MLDSDYAVKLYQTKKNIFNAIKVISISLISGAIGLELSNIYASFWDLSVPTILEPVFWLERFAVTMHLVEAIIAAAYAPSRQKKPIVYGTYTFFVGTVGLLELFDQEDE